jgi:hypothetical protein
MRNKRSLRAAKHATEAKQEDIVGNVPYMLPPHHSLHAAMHASEGEHVPVEGSQALQVPLHHSLHAARHACPSSAADGHADEQNGENAPAHGPSGSPPAADSPYLSSATAVADAKVTKKSRQTPAPAGDPGALS